jgi:hypothetical protein
MTAVALGFRAGRGGSVVVGVAADGPSPRLVLSTFLATAAEGDRLAFEPYQVAYEMPRDQVGGPTAEAAAAVAEGRRRQAALAATALAGVLDRLERGGFRPAVAALLINRAGWMTDLLEHSLSAPEHPPVAEGLAVRVALRAAFAGANLNFVEMDEKSLRESAALTLPVTPARIDVEINALGATAGRPWRKEQKAACLAAWVAAAGLGEGPSAVRRDVH